MICHRLLSGNEDSFRLAMSSGLTLEEKCTQYKLASLARRYRLCKEDVLDILDGYVGSSKELNEFFEPVELSLTDLDEKFIEALRKIADISKLNTLEEDFEWYLKLILMEW